MFTHGQTVGDMLIFGRLLIICKKERFEVQLANDSPRLVAIYEPPRPCSASRFSKSSKACSNSPIARSSAWLSAGESVWSSAVSRIPNTCSSRRRTVVVSAIRTPPPIDSSGSYRHWSKCSTACAVGREFLVPELRIQSCSRSLVTGAKADPMVQASGTAFRRAYRVATGPRIASVQLHPYGRVINLGQNWLT